MNSSNLNMYADPINIDREIGGFEAEGSILLELAAQAAATHYQQL